MSANPAKGSGDAHVEQLAPVPEWRLDPDHGPQRAEGKGYRSRNRIRKRRADSIVAAGEVVTQFVSQENRQDADGIGNSEKEVRPKEETRRVGRGLPVAHHEAEMPERPGPQGGEEGDEEQQKGQLETGLLGHRLRQVLGLGRTFRH